MLLREGAIFMGTTQIAATLYQLQQIDLDLDRLKAEQQTITQALQGSATLRRLWEDYKTAQQQLQASLQAQKEAEWTNEDLTRRLNEQEQRLYNGATRGAKELQALQQEVQRLRAQQNRQEEQLLEAIDGAESMAEVVQQKAAQVKEAEDAWQKEREKLIADREQVEGRSQKTQERRAKLTTGLPEELVKRYDGMRKSKQGRAISKVEQNSCQWCRVILTPSELQKVRVSPELQTCTNCGRILYYERG
jgi:predicted  nucleic acid-binding Zn-ribbon protein